MTATRRQAPHGEALFTGNREKSGDSTSALAVACPICDAQSGDACQDAIRGWVRTVNPHLYRALLAKEATK